MGSARSTQVMHIQWKSNIAINEYMAWLLGPTRGFFLRVCVGKGELQEDWWEVLDVGAGCRQAWPAQRAGVTISLCQGLHLKHMKMYSLRQR